MDSLCDFTLPLRRALTSGSELIVLPMSFVNN